MIELYKGNDTTNEKEFNVMENTKKIIICDGNKEFCNILNDYLSNQRDIIVTGVVNDGTQLLKLIQEKEPDLVILDIIMPHLDGLRVLESLNIMNVDPMPRIIILSTVSEDKLIQRALTLGADRYMVKPFNLGSLIKIIRQMFDKNLQSDDLKKALTYHEVLKAKRRLYEEDTIAKMITETEDFSEIEKHNKYKKWVKDQFSVWDISNTN